MLKVIVNILIAGLAGQISWPWTRLDSALISEEAVSSFGVETKRKESAVLGVTAAREPERIKGESQGLKLSAKSALVIDRESGKVLFEKDVKKRLPVASISKLISALVFLEGEIDWEKTVFMKQSDYVGGASLKVRAGEGLGLKDLFYAALISSSNNAIKALVRMSGLSDREFMVVMNKKTKELGMLETYFAEPTGLNMVNHSTALDIALLLQAALDNEDIREALKREEYSFKTRNTGRWIKVENTDKLLASFLNNGDGYEILGGKTGYTSEAGYCFAAGIKGPRGQEIIVVVLGAESNGARFQEVKGLAWWVFNNWQW